MNPHHDSSPPLPLTAEGEVREPREVRELRDVRDRDHDADKVDAVAGSEFVDDLIRLPDDDRGA